MPVHPQIADVEQDRPSDPGSHCAVDRARDRWWQRHQHHLGALADDSQHTVPVFLTQVGDVRAGGFEDPQPEQTEHRHQGEVVGVR
jgi:hypothetical protein